jgi:hypothetical protein
MGLSSKYGDFFGVQYRHIQPTLWILLVHNINPVH